jgi:hypothetical protein
MCYIVSDCAFYLTKGWKQPLALQTTALELLKMRCMRGSSVVVDPRNTDEDGCVEFIED